MPFLFPAWLLLLIPWAALTVYLLRGNPPKAGVPFLFLWPDDYSAKPHDHRRHRLPPAGIILMLIATALAILAAAGPRLGRPHAVPVLIIVDRGLSMSATNAQSIRRFAEAANLAAQWLSQRIPHVEVKFQIVPPLAQSNDAASIGDLKMLQPTAVDTRDPLNLAVHEAVRSFNGPIIVLTDEQLTIHDSNLIQIPPRSGISEVAISALNVRVDPPQAMVTILNASDNRKATLTLTADSVHVYSATVTLPARGEQRNYFVDLPAGAKTISASIDDRITDDLTHQAWSVRRDAWPIVEARSDLPPELRRMIEVYSRHRPASSDSPRVAIVRQGEPIPPHDPAVILASGISKLLATQPVAVQGALQFPGVDWQTALAGASISPVSPGWQPAVIAAGATVVAVQPGSPKRIWVGFSSNTFPRQAGYVVFWTEIFDWLGAGIPEFSSSSPSLLKPDWRRVEPAALSTEPGLTPGLYQNSNGALLAVNAEPLQPSVLNPVNNASPIFHPVSDVEHSIAAAPALLFGAVLLSALALLVWPSFRVEQI